MSCQLPRYTPIDPQAIIRRRSRPLPKPLFIRPPAQWDAGSDATSIPSTPPDDILPNLIPTPFYAPLDAAVALSPTPPSPSDDLSNLTQPDTVVVEALQKFQDVFLGLEENLNTYETVTQRIQESLGNIACLYDEMYPKVIESLSLSSPPSAISRHPSLPEDRHYRDVRGCQSPIILSPQSLPSEVLILKERLDELQAILVDQTDASIRVPQSVLVCCCIMTVCKTDNPGSVSLLKRKVTKHFISDPPLRLDAHGGGWYWKLVPGYSSLRVPEKWEEQSASRMEGRRWSSGRIRMVTHWMYLAHHVLVTLSRQT
ncbi:hypothetical protein SISSUDRAFT_1036782 [Sistotremastrum suecicum HHB10207 ss-3]|uniref:Uncharacterized protein n=1 Tax=Sistotremastrum suecicum HHB10207 ss-3 TaxID=1314776 RepID=A0A165Z106_9AGAM|nr:hypothetical protein SISSUDRAFT_1036782 [Sistotremastrum suecicum HHB10207 ss-3]